MEYIIISFAILVFITLTTILCLVICIASEYKNNMEDFKRHLKNVTKKDVMNALEKLNDKQ